MPVPAAQDLNNWSAKHNWWFVDGALAYGWTGFAALVGLRYDNYTASLTSPNNLGLFNGQQEASFLSSAWIPFIGFQSAYTDTIQSLKIRMLGIPTIVGYSYVGLTVARLGIGSSTTIRIIQPVISLKFLVNTPENSLDHHKLVSSCAGTPPGLPVQGPAKY